MRSSPAAASGSAAPIAWRWPKKARRSSWRISRRTPPKASRAEEAYGRIDVLVNNAGLYSSIQKKPFFDIPVEEWDRVMAVNVKGVFLCARAVHPQMKKQRSGKIINTRALSREVGQDNICVNAITPGLTIADEKQKAMLSEEYLAPRRQARALKRDQYPQDLVGTVLFLASSDSDFITGQTINVDGGTWML